MAENPATSWLTGMVDVVGHASRCGLIPKRLDPASIGLPPYLPDDRIGKDGLEAAYEAELRGRAGIQTLLVDALQLALGIPIAAVLVFFVVQFLKPRPPPEGPTGPDEPDEP